MIHTWNITTFYKKNIISEALDALTQEDTFLNRTPIIRALRSTINKWDLMGLKSFYKAKDLTEWENNFTPHLTEG